MAATADEFKGALRRWASGVTVVTARTADADLGMTASSFSSLSVTPPRILVCVARTAAVHAAVEAAGAFAVTVLADDQSALSNRFAGYGPKDQDRWADLDEIRAPVSGARWLPGGTVWLDCKVDHAFDGGDHTIFVGLVEQVRTNDEREPTAALLYLAGRYRKVGDAI